MGTNIPNSLNDDRTKIIIGTNIPNSLNADRTTMIIV